MLGKLTVYKNRIVYYYRDGKKTLRYATGVTLKNPVNFQNGKLSKNEIDFAKKNMKILSVGKRIDGIIMQYIGNNNGLKPEVDYIKRELEKPEDSQIKSILELFAEFYEDVQKKTKYGTYKMYKLLRNSLEKFVNTTGKKNITQIDYDFISSFEDFLSGYSNATVVKRITQFKRFVKWLIKKDYSVDKRVLEYEMATKRLSSDTIIVFEEDEIIKLSELSLSGHQERVRDVMLFLIMTGIRYSDLNQINNHQVKNGVLEIFATKTNEKCEIPLNVTANDILLKYHYKISLMAEQVFNRSIKEILRQKDICNYDIQKDFKRNNFTKYIIKKKYDLISSKVGRASFISHLIKQKCSLNQIMRATGHKQLQVVMSYMRRFGEKDNSFTKGLEIENLKKLSI